MSHVLLLDTNVWSHLKLSNEAKRLTVQAGLDALLKKYPGAARATSAICVAECLVAARRMSDPLERAAAEQAFQSEFTNPDLMVVEVSQDLLDKAATMRAEVLRRGIAAGGSEAGADGGKLKLPDAVVCYVDSTIGLPILAAYALAKHAPRPLRRLYAERGRMMDQLKKLATEAGRV